MPEKYIATDDTRTYSFFLINNEPELITINMYNSIYIFIKKNGDWINHISNKMAMASNLISAVIRVLPR